MKVWTDLGESDWSDSSQWEHGLLSGSAWSARWIAPIERDGLPARQRPVQQLAGAFTIDGTVVSARLYATAHGVYEAFLNGTRVGDIELTPGSPPTARSLHVQTYDVTDPSTSGENILGALLSDGWWRGPEQRLAPSRRLRHRPPRS